MYNLYKIDIEHKNGNNDHGFTYCFFYIKQRALLIV